MKVNEYLKDKEMLKKWAVFFVLFMAFFFIGRYSAPAEVVVEESVKYVEVLSDEIFDTSALEMWDGDFSRGKLRMVGAWMYGYDTSGNPIVVDEERELWTLTGYSVGNEEFLLLWIADSGTENVHDDVVMKVWTEKVESIESVG